MPTPTPAPTPTPTPAPMTMTITIEGINGNMSFSPNPASVKVGQQVVWHNADSITHTASGSFDTGTIAPGTTSKVITFSASGTISYHCSIHPSMVGTLNVTP
jgi:plastocyanin